MSTRAYTDDMDEISGLGDTYEAGCRVMVLAGLDWLDAHPDAVLKFSGFKRVFGYIKEETDDARALVKAMCDAANAAYPSGGVTGAMVHACTAHVCFIRENGWDAYAEKMRARRAAAAKEQQS